MATIKDNLIQMKNTSELMVDLAYSALFLRSKRLVQQVFAKGEELKKYEEETLKLLFRVKIPEGERLTIIDLMSSIMEFGHAAKQIADLAKTKAYPPILRDILKNHKLKSRK